MALLALGLALSVLAPAAPAGARRRQQEPQPVCRLSLESNPELASNPLPPECLVAGPSAPRRAVDRTAEPRAAAEPPSLFSGLARSLGFLPAAFDGGSRRGQDQYGLRDSVAARPTVREASRGNVPSRGCSWEGDDGSVHGFMRAEAAWRACSAAANSARALSSTLPSTFRRTSPPPPPPPMSSAPSASAPARPPRAETPAPSPRPKPPVAAPRGGPSAVEPPMGTADDAAQKALSRHPIWAPFKARFDQCAPGCRPIVTSLYRPGAMCHGYGAAIDVGGLQCPDGTHYAINSRRASGRFAQLVECMTGGTQKSVSGRDGLWSLWYYSMPGAPPNDDSMNHRNHAHFSVGCGGSML